MLVLNGWECDMSNLIEGISPLVIAHIDHRNAFRCRKHPLWYKVMRKRHPIQSALGMFQDPLFGYFQPATVRIFANNGNRILTITCKSNARAKELSEELNAKLEDFLVKLTVVPVYEVKGGK